MKLKLHCKTHDGKQEDWIYDNVTNEIWNSNGDLVDLSKDERLKPYAMTKQRGKPSPVSNHKSNEIWNLKIQLGLKCNMHCKYCAQTGNEIGASVFTQRDVEPFIKKLVDNKIEVVGSIELWGGEPFVYWKVLQKLIPELRRIYPKASIGMITNGTLLTEEKIEFLEKYKCGLTFSHDGLGFHLRGKDPLDDPKMVDLWRLAIQKLGANINCVLTPANIDINATAEYIREKLGGVYFNFEGVMTHVGVQDSELMFTPAQMLTLQKNIFNELTKNGWDKFPALTNECNELLLQLTQRKKLDLGTVKCGMNRENVCAINLNGDVLSCHDFATKDKYVGHVSAMDKVDISKHFKSCGEREKCRKCLLLPMCRGACPQIEGLARTLTCKNEFNYHFAIFQAVWWLLFGLTIESYEVVEQVTL